MPNEGSVQERTESRGRRVGPRPGSWALAAVVAVGVALRLWRLGSLRLGFDEAFSAMTARRPLGSLFSFLRVGDSHPPLDYLLQVPFARAGASDFLIRLPSALCSIAALVLFAIWMRPRGRVGLIATAIMAVNVFQLIHGRTARMYAVMELVGVLSAMLLAAWLRRPRNWHPPAVALLVLAGLLTHVSMFLLGAGLLLAAGLRRDRDAWKWRAGLAAGLAGWSLLWGPSFLAQARGGHSDWIPRTSLHGIVKAIGSLVVSVSALHAVALMLVLAGGVLVVRRGGTMTRVWCCCFVVPSVLAAVIGFAAPALLDRTLTVASWGALFAVAMVLDRFLAALPRIAVAALVGLGVFGLVNAVSVAYAGSLPNTTIRHLQAVVQPGDVVAVRPAHRRPEVVWPLEITSGLEATPVQVPALHHSSAVQLGDRGWSSRVWLVEWRPTHIADGLPRCAPDWNDAPAEIMCLSVPSTASSTPRE